ncbi:cell division ATP-binding protein FtsE [Bdellovibrio svalbardensis]|uniref:ATP-binding cassette domain-containing protein n=1 Tax=Bdellovibrio svalbardensis TaxID=2972972 RepID=A0ABT6DR25_9BACT|nr:ATP-binding cassette domain-containing protein [Bdellovibrio svalbardensis]MDG0818281.1 ATP-binding cassette domain-containing protein [Bdellovibrio svalbardensis]
MKIESLKFEGVSFSHDGQDPVIQNVEFDFPMNEIIWVKAEEGAGKSSLLQVLGGLQIPQSGQYLINGENVVDMSFEEFLPYRLAIGYSFDYGGLINNRTLYDNLMLPLLYHKVVSQQEAKERVDEMVSIFDIGKFINERPAHVPGRIRKLTCLMRSVVMRPQVLLMDDPSVGLGQDSVYTFVDYLHKLRKEGSLNHVFISSYDEKFMNLMSYQIIHLDEGQLYFQAVDPEKRVVHL